MHDLNFRKFLIFGFCTSHSIIVKLYPDFLKNFIWFKFCFNFINLLKTTISLNDI
jgi:hypothetical protein